MADEDSSAQNDVTASDSSTFEYGGLAGFGCIIAVGVLSVMAMTPLIGSILKGHHGMVPWSYKVTSTFFLLCAGQAACFALGLVAAFRDRGFVAMRYAGGVIGLIALTYVIMLALMMDESEP